MKRITYAEAGVDLGKYDGLVGIIKRELRRSSASSGAGHFAGTIGIRPREGRIVVASVDSVGTKVRVAVQCGSHAGLGKDIVSHCVNDILCAGARPIAFLDYIAFDRLDAGIFRRVLAGIARECRKYGIQLIGGETAELPGVYAKGQYDLVGMIIGLASKSLLIDGSKIMKGDLVVGLPSSGLHTNGYSLARKVLLERRGMRLDARPAGWREPLGKVLLRPHTNYFREVYPLAQKRLLSGIAHITGGGIAGNLARILPRRVDAVIRRSTWHAPEIFGLIARSGPVDSSEMFRVFNMGLGMLLVVPPSNLPKVMMNTRASRVVGEIVEGSGSVILQ